MASVENCIFRDDFFKKKRLLNIKESKLKSPSVVDDVLAYLTTPICDVTKRKIVIICVFRRILAYHRGMFFKSIVIAI